MHAENQLLDKSTNGVEIANFEFARVAIPSPLYTLFDYRWPRGKPLLAGVRVSVPFGRRNVVGIVLSGAKQSAVPSNKLRSVTKVLDQEPVLDERMLTLLEWASRYYHHPIGEVLSASIPVLLRRANAAELTQRETYLLHPKADPAAVPTRAAVQLAVFNCLTEAQGEPVDASVLATLSPRWRTAAKALIEKQVILCKQDQLLPFNKAVETGPELVAEQQHALSEIDAAAGTFQPFLLNGVTGSGKTEVYLRALESVQQRGQQVLLLVPEISLTPQLMRRFQRRVTGCLVSLHSGLNNTERMQNWLLAAKGHADVIIGTRSAVLVPLPRLGLVIIDEEHDGSLKQQDGFRYHARDLALLRARDNACPIVLGTATPSFESLNNVVSGRFKELLLTQRAGEAKPPLLSLLDIRRRALIEGISDRLFEAIRKTLEEGSQALVFINRRGYAPTLLCNDCGACADCKRCDAHMTVHSARRRLRCHHCGSERSVPVQCEACGSENLDSIGYGTERIADALMDAFPDVRVARIDRDTTRNKGALQEQLEAATSGEARLLVGTQMLAKGHHFPGVTLVGILDADRGLFGTDFRSLEQMGQLILQVAGRAGREKKQGTVLIQTRNPDSEMMQTLVVDGYAEFAKHGLAERKLALLPPYSFVALVRAEATDAESPMHFLRAVSARLSAPSLAGVMVLGPVPAPMERLGGKYRAQLYVQADKRSSLNTVLSRLTSGINDLEGARRTRWSIDVDPVDLF